MRKSIIATVMMLMALTATAWGQPGPRDFVLRNRTDQTITGFWFRVPPNGPWTPMQGETIGPNQASDVHFTGGGACALQFRVQVSSGIYAAFSRAFNFCEVTGISIYYNHDDATFTARATY